MDEKEFVRLVVEEVKKQEKNLPLEKIASESTRFIEEFVNFYYIKLGNKLIIGSEIERSYHSLQYEKGLIKDSILESEKNWYYDFLNRNNLIKLNKAGIDVPAVEGLDHMPIFERYEIFGSIKKPGFRIETTKKGKTIYSQLIKPRWKEYLLGRKK